MLRRGVPALTMNSGARRANEDTVSSASIVSGESDIVIGFLCTYATRPELCTADARTPSTAVVSRSAIKSQEEHGAWWSVTSHRSLAPTRSPGR
jgi:hypothetical protein